MPTSADLEAETLDHAGEFVARVAEVTPTEYSGLMENSRVQQLLAGKNSINPGKIYAWAEYRVFRREFQRRFPDASPKACINAFCRLFLKNDISMSNLVRALEPGPNEDVVMLEQNYPDKEKPAG